MQVCTVVSSHTFPTTSGGLMLLWMSSGVEVFAVGVCEGDVETGAAFEFADAGGNGSEVLGGLGEGESSLVSEGSEVVDAWCGAWVDEEVPGLAGDGSFEAAQDVFLGFAGGLQFRGVGLGARVGGQTHERDLVECPVALPVTAAVEAVSGGLSGAGGDRGGAAERGERCFGAEPVGVVAGGDQQGRGP